MSGNPDSPIARPVTPAAIHRLADQALLDRRVALSWLDRGPEPAVWQRLADVALAAAGAGFLGAAVIYAVAFNWDDLGRFAQHGIVATALAVCVGFAGWRFPSVPAKASLAMAFLLVGALLALFGQTYQTGVDPWQLFAGWAVLTLPWAVVATTPALWAGQVVLWNVSLGLWWSQTGQARLAGEFELPQALVLLNTGAWLAAEGAGRHVAGLDERWWPRTCVVVALAVAAVAAVVARWGAEPGRWVAELELLVLLVLVLPLGRRDVALWALGGTALIVHNTSWALDLLSNREPLARDELGLILQFAGAGAVAVVELVVLVLLLGYGRRRLGVAA